MGPSNENRHEILLKVGGFEIPVLCNTGAAVTCSSKATFEKYFTRFQRMNHNAGVKGAAGNTLGLSGVY